MELVFYLIGFVLAYILIKQVHYLEGEKQTWGLVGLRVIVSMLSWVVVFTGVLTWLANVISKLDSKTKPPRWL